MLGSRSSTTKPRAAKYHGEVLQAVTPIIKLDLAEGPGQTVLLQILDQVKPAYLHLGLPGHCVQGANAGYTTGKRPWQGINRKEVGIVPRCSNIAMRTSAVPQQFTHPAIGGDIWISDRQYAANGPHFDPSSKTTKIQYIIGFYRRMQARKWRLRRSPPRSKLRRGSRDSDRYRR